MNNNRIAIVDDDEVFLFLTQRMLERRTQGFEMMAYTDSKKALQEIDSNLDQLYNLPGIIFLDLVMPELSGWQFLQELEKIRAGYDYEPHIFIMSANENIDFNRIKLFPLINGYLVKPVSIDKLVSVINAIEVS